MLLKNGKKNVILFDVNHYMHRNYHGRPEAFSGSGRECHMFNGTIDMLKKHIKELQPDHYVFLFDGKNNFRKVVYPDYKGGRSEKTESFLEQEEDIYQYLKASGAPVYKEDSYEADDLIASMINSIGGDYNFYISSKDKDLYQLVSDNVFILDTKYNKETNEKYKVHDTQYAKDKFGVPPEKIGLLLTLMGDKADNLKFIQNIGEKTAAKIVEEFSSLSDIVVAEDHKLINKYKEQIIKNLDKLYMAEMLIRLFDCKDYTESDLLNKNDKDVEKMNYLKVEKYGIKNQS